MARVDSKLQFRGRLIFDQHIERNWMSERRQLTKCWRENQEASDTSRLQSFNHKCIYLSHNIGVCRLSLEVVNMVRIFDFAEWPVCILIEGRQSCCMYIEILFAGCIFLFPKGQNQVGDNICVNGGRVVDNAIDCDEKRRIQLAGCK